MLVGAKDSGACGDIGDKAMRHGQLLIAAINGVSALIRLEQSEHIKGVTVSEPNQCRARCRARHRPNRTGGTWHLGSTNRGQSPIRQLARSEPRSRDRAGGYRHHLNNPRRIVLEHSLGAGGRRQNEKSPRNANKNNTQCLFALRYAIKNVQLASLS